HDDEVDVLDDLAHRVFLHVLHERELALAADLEVEQGVRLAQDEAHLVAWQRHVLRLGAVTVDDRGDLAGGADLAGRALAELVAGFRDELVVVGHGDSLWWAQGPSWFVVNSNAQQREERRGPYHRVDHGSACTQRETLAEVQP